MADDFVIQLRGISKGFPGVQALSEVDFDLKEGEVHALVGENGAGKSTLIKILSGSIRKDSGDVVFQGRLTEVREPQDAFRLGISTIYQENSLVQGMNVAENVFLGRYPVKLGKIDWGQVQATTKSILDSLFIKLSPRALVSELSPGEQQLVEISKALSYNAKVLIMDEPTSSLTEEDTNQLFEIIRALTKRKISVIYITHRLKEIFQIADRVTVLRDGRVIQTLAPKDTNNDEIVRYMIGKELGDYFSGLRPEPKETTVLEVRGLTRRGKYQDINFTLREGEILGFFGLVGAGRTDIMKSVLGFIKIDSGEIFLDQRKVVIRNPTEAFAKGFAFVSEDRRSESIIQRMTVRENLTIVMIRKFLSKLGLLSLAKERSFSDACVEKFAIRTPTIEQLAMNLSGGNQQRLAIAKALSTDPRVLILDEPTRGIDVQSKKYIYDLIKGLASKNLSTIVVSSETPEIIGICNRVLVIREGRLMKELSGQDITERNLLNAAVGNV